MLGIHRNRAIGRQGACQQSAAHWFMAAMVFLRVLTRPAHCRSLCSCSMSVVSADQATFLVMGAVGSSHEATTIPNTVTVVRGSASSVEMIVNGTVQSLQQKPPTGRSDDSVSCDNSSQALQWAQEDGVPPPSDWLALQCAGVWRACARSGRSCAGCSPLLGPTTMHEHRWLGVAGRVHATAAGSISCKAILSKLAAQPNGEW